MQPHNVVGLNWLLENVKPPEWLVDNFLPVHGLVVITGEGYSGKTMFGLEMGIAVSQGVPFMNRFKVRQGNALYVGEDPPGWDVTAQCRKLLVGKIDPMNPNRSMYQGEIYDTFEFAIHDGASFSTDLGAGRIIETAKKCEATLVILDSLRDLHDGDENDSGQMRNVMDRIQLLREMTGASILVIHHAGKPKEGQYGIHKARGSSTITQKADAHLHLVHYKKTGNTVIQVPKSRALTMEEFHCFLEYDDEMAKWTPLDETEISRDAEFLKKEIDSKQLISRKRGLEILKELHKDAKLQTLNSMFYRAMIELTVKQIAKRAKWERGIYVPWDFEEREPGEGRWHGDPEEVDEN